MGDRNSRFFHQSAIQRRKRNTISCLKVENDTWVDEPDEVKNYIKGFYQHLFTEERVVTDYSVLNEFPVVITERMNRAMTKEVTDGEIKTAVFQMGPLKAPGPDGFPCRFFQKHWDIVGEGVCREVREFFNTSRIPEGWNDTNITLIPKVQNPEAISQYRPISVTNFRSKIIAKILATRVKPFTPLIISELQAAFTGNRTIQDNIVVAHEAVHRMKHRKKEKVVEWVQAMISSVRFNVLINGSQSGYFHPTRGLRQGDPLSPFLFIIVSNVLSFLMNRAVDSRFLTGVKLTPRCPVLHHILFADDTVLFGTASSIQATRMKVVIKVYCRLSGQAVNEAKSAILFSKNTPDDIKELVSEVFGVDVNTKLGKYLGLPLEWGNSKVEAFQYLTQRLQSKAQSWKSLLLSQAGRETLVKAVLQAVPTFIFSCFELPRKTIKKMEEIMGR
ncbi:Transposon TX1 uncharacterized 149 kDa protein [Linum perenne]